MPRFIDLIAIFSTAEHQRVLESVIGTVCLTDSYQSVVFAVENDVPLLKILTDNENCHFVRGLKRPWCTPQGFLSALITTWKFF